MAKDPWSDDDEDDGWYVKPKGKSQPKPSKPAPKAATSKQTPKPKRAEPADEDEWGPKKPKPRKKWYRGWWWKVPLLAVVLLLLLVLFLPTLLSTNVVKRIVLDQANGYLNGTVHVEKWSFGWLTGVKIEGIEVRGAGNDVVASVGRISLPHPLWRLAMMDLKFGDARIENVFARVELDEKGATNLQRLVKNDGSAVKTPASPAPAATAAGPSPLPEIVGKLTIDGLAVDVLLVKPDPATGRRKAWLPVVGLMGSTRIVSGINTIDGTVTNDIALDVGVAKQRLGRVSLAGSAKVLKNRMVDVAGLRTEQTLRLEGFELGKLQPVLAALGMDLKLDGKIDGKIVSAASDGGKQASVRGKVELHDVEAGGKLLGGNDLRVPYLVFPLDLTYLKDAGGRIQIRETGAIPGQDRRIVVDADLPVPMLEDLAANRRPSQSGNVKLTVDLPDIPGLVAWVPGRAASLPVKLENGRLRMDTDVAIGADDIGLSTRLSASGVQVALAPEKKLGPLDVELTSAAHLQTGVAPLDGLHDVRLTVQSSGVGLEVTLPKFGQLDVKGDLDLAAVRAAIASVADTGPLQAGRGEMAMSVMGNPLHPGEMLKTKMGITFSDLDFRFGRRRASASVPRALSLDVAGDLLPATSDRGAAIGGGRVGLAVGAKTDPLLQVGTTFACEMPADTAGKVADQLVAALAAAKVDGLVVVNLAKAQAAANEIAKVVDSPTTVRDGKLVVRFGTTLKPGGHEASSSLTVSTEDLSLLQKQKSAPTIPPALNVAIATSVSKRAGEFRGDVHLLDVALGDVFTLHKKTGRLGVTSSAKRLDAGGGVAMVLDLMRLDGVLRDFSGAGLIPASMKGVALRGGEIRLNADATMLPEGEVGATADVGVQVTLDTPGGKVDEKLTTGLEAKAAKGMSSLDATVKVDHRLFNVLIDKVQLALGKDADGTTTALDLLRSARVKVLVPDLVAVQDLAGKFASPAPAATVPAEAAKLERGGISIETVCERQGLTSRVDTEVDLNGMAISLGGRRYDFRKPNVVKVGVDVSSYAEPPSGDLMASIASVSLRAMSADMEVGALKLVSPWTLNEPAKLMAPPVPVAPAGAAAVHEASAPTLPDLPEFGIQFDSDFDRLAVIGETLLGKARGTLIPVTGSFQVVQKAGISEGKIQANGELTLNKLVYAQDKKRWAEDKLQLSHKVAFDPAKDALRIEEVKLSLAGSKALDVVISGDLQAVSTDRPVAQGVEVKIQPDYAKLWAMAKPMMSADQQKDMADLVVRGKNENTIRMTGPLALGTQPKDMLMGAVVECDLALEYANWPSKGVRLENFALPVDLVESVLYTTHKSGATRPQTTAKCNGGDLDLMDLTFELFDPHPRLTSPQNKQIVKALQLNNVLAGSLGSVSPMFVDSKRASGSVDVTIANADRFPVDDLMKSETPDNDGYLKVMFSVNDLDMMSDKLNSMIQMGGFKASNGGRVQANIKDGSAEISKGWLTHDVKLDLGGQVISAYGEMKLATNYYKKMTVALPSAMVTSGAKTVIPETITLKFHGPANALEMEGGVLGDVAGGLLKNAAGKALP